MSEPSNELRGELGTTPHPGAEFARKWWNALSLKDRAMLTESFASVALSGNFSAEVCSETIRRIDDNEQLSDRYLMGLVLCSMHVLGQIQ